MNLDANSAQTDHSIADREKLVALIERIVSSQTFRKSQKLREFFRFVCECAIRHGDCAEVKEQQVGAHVFNRSPDYNTSEDSIVRVSARELRRRLVSYFETEGKGEAIVITIPKGGYLPLFLQRGSAAYKAHDSAMAQLQEEESSKETSPMQEQEGRHASFLARWILAGVIGSALFAAGWLAGNQVNRSSAGRYHVIISPVQSSYYDALLGPMGLNGNNTFLVLSNMRLLYFGPYRPLNANSSGNTLIPLPSGLQKQLADATGLGNDPHAPFNLMLVGNGYTDIGEAASAFYISRMMLAMGRDIRLTQGRFLNWDTAMRENLIVVGKPDINDWTHANLPTSNFVMAPHGVRNNMPMAGEQGFYQVSVDSMNNMAEDYGVISMSTTASGSRILLLAGRTPAGTHGVGEFFANPEKMRLVYDKLNAMKSGKDFPQSWEALVKRALCENLGKALFCGDFEIL